ncbi:MAG: DUF4388 domain-containing protein [Acidobacteriota bacterium]
MAVTGRLEETGVPGILQVFAQGKKTGRLTFSSSDSQAVVVLHEGQLVYAASNAVRETLGHCLISRGTIDGDTLAEALSRQHASKNSVRLGNVLQEMGAVSEEEVLEIVTGQARRVLREIVDWTVGFFKFEKMEFDDGGEIPVDLNDFLMEEGLRVDRVLLDIALDEEEDESDEEDVTALSLSLREVIGQVSHPTINAEVTQALLSFSSAFLDRAVLLLHDSGGFEGIAHFGLPAETSEAVRDVRIPDSDQLFAEVLENRQCTTNPLTPEALGKLAHVFEVDEAREVVICPLVVNDEVLLLLVGEAGGRSIGSADLLEAVMLQTGLVMEKALLQQRVSSLEKELEELKSKAEAAPEPTESRVSLASGGLAQPSGAGIAESSQRIADLLAGRTQG